MQKTTLENLHTLLVGQPGVAQLSAVLGSLLVERHVTLDSVQAEKLESHHGRVYRLHFASHGYTAGSFVVKRLEPTVARRNELLLRRWLPAAGLSDCGPELLGVAADPAGQWRLAVLSVWGVGAAPGRDAQRSRSRSCC